MLRRITHGLARLLPRDLRDAHGDEITRDIDRRFAAGQPFSTFTDIAGAVVRERRATVRSHMFQDVRFAVRLLGRRPWFSAAVVLILGLGIGGTTAIVTLARATLLRPVDVPDPDRLVVRGGLSYQDFRTLQHATDVADAVMAYGSAREGASLNRRGETRRVGATLVSGNYFEGLGVRPAAGRLLTATDEAPGGVPAVVISHRLWSTAFNRSDDVIGETVQVNRRPVVIVGVAPAGFKGLALSSVADVWMPAAFTPELATGFIARPAALTGGMTWLNVVARLKDGVTYDQAAARFAALIDQDPAGSRTPAAVVPIASAIVIENARGDLRTFVFLLMAVAAVLLLLGCTNVANLLLARGASRSHEIAVRAALGAGRGRLVAQLVIEGAVLAALGGAAGVVIAVAALAAVGHYRLPGDIPIADLGLGLDVFTLATSALLAVASVAIAGPLPAWLVTRRDLRATLSAGGRGATRLPLGRLLVAGQVALCVTLVGGGLVFARGLQRALAFDLGYEPSGVAMTTADPALERLKAAEVDHYIDISLEQLRRDPRVTAAGISFLRPMRGGISTSVIIDGRAPDKGDDPHISANLVSEGWFEAMGLRLVSGRTFRPEDRGAWVGVISQQAAREFWPNRNPIGARFKFDSDADAPFYEVIGVVADARYGKVDADTRPFVYLSIFDTGMASFRSQLHFFARTTGDPAPIIGRIRDAARAAHPSVPLSFAMTMEEHVASVLMPQRLGLVLLMVFATAGVMLSAAGIYAVAAYQVTIRTREIGIRMALGAARLRVVKDVVRDGAVPVAGGVAAGLIAHLWASRFATQFVYGLDVRAPTLLFGAAAIVVAAALTALLIPARRAAGVDPVVALRES